jgi:hypothetical protein
MNERIKELIEQSTAHLPKTKDSGEGWIFNKEKFAELIVRDCVGIVENQGRFLKYDTLSKKIKQHFGVE